jgi:3-oxo-5-alpha-steroid 4-dehydrogenase 3
MFSPIFTSHIPILLSSYYIGLSIAVLGVTTTATFRRHFLAYGKLRQPSNNRTLLDRLGQLTVPKRRFRDFYLVGWIWHTLLCLATCYNQMPSLSTRQWIVASLFSVQLARRFYECQWIEKPSPQSRIHVGHYLVGISYYFITSLSIWYHGSICLNGSFYILIGIGLFIYASLHQHQCHCILAKLRDQPKHAHTYHIPFGDWFEYVSSPHYFAELLIYTSLALILGLPQVWFSTFLWILVNLGTTAHRTHQWYHTTFPHYPKQRKAWIPYIW